MVRRGGQKRDGGNGRTDEMQEKERQRRQKMKMSTSLEERQEEVGIE